MKKTIATIALSLFGSLAIASNCILDLTIDKVVFQVSARQWVTTQTALLTVNINATLTGANLVKTRADIMERLTKIATGDWHITQFDRSQDESGLEKLFVEAQARIPQASLTSIYQNAKDVSQPGTTYTVNRVEFKPSLEEIQQAKWQLRERLYEQVKEELNRLNKIYTNQNYTVNNLSIQDESPVQFTKTYQERSVKPMMLGMALPAAAPITLSNEITMTAMVEAGSNRQPSNVPNH